MSQNSLRDRKNTIRAKALEDRRTQPDKDACSERILDSAMGLSGFQQADTVLFYVHIRTEVRTLAALEAALASGKRIGIPYCVGDRLDLFHLESFDELEKATFGILEPRLGVRSLPEKRLRAEELDLVLVPGVAFDPGGSRIGYGRGYFDRLLSEVRDSTPRIALAFQCQIFDAIPVSQHDIPMTGIVTEQQIYDCR